MRICGIKLTHDGAVALVDDGSLVFSHEVEKLANNPRYEELYELGLLERALSEHGLELADVDAYAVDGWDETVVGRYGAVSRRLEVASYEEPTTESDVLQPYRYAGLPIGPGEVAYSSYTHTAGHVLSGYATSSFARAGEDAFVLVWDGGIAPRLYFVDAGSRRIAIVDPALLPILGNTYAAFASRLSPFEADDPTSIELSAPGKVMAYTALGRVDARLVDVVKISCAAERAPRGEYGVELGSRMRELAIREGFTNADVLASFQAALGELLVASVEAALRRSRREGSSLVFCGGSALNIVWNTMLRESPVVGEVWIPPFPNDSGSALGAACAAFAASTGSLCLDWDVYRGPKLHRNRPAEGWRAEPCSVEKLAHILHSENEPVVFLNGRAELGPRALGNRSILAPAVDASMKDRLNEIKGRAAYRPVAPICLEHRAPEIFDPGSPDPYMLFTHRVRDRWVDRVPAILHLDGTARLQTVSETQNPSAAALLSAYERLTGIPVLCNTSANLEGRGFFPDLYTPTAWRRTKYVWFEGMLYVDTAGSQAER